METIMINIGARHNSDLGFSVGSGRMTHDTISETDTKTTATEERWCGAR